MKHKPVFWMYGIGFGAACAGAVSLHAASFLLSPVWPAPAVASRPADAVSIAQPKAAAAPLAVTRIAHASVLLDFDGVRVLTDPWFTEKWHYHQGDRHHHHHYGARVEVARGRGQG